jgi:hypothetical protein
MSIESALFWDITQPRVVILYHVSGQRVCRIVTGQEVQLLYDEVVK